jgi:hypothetical protein
VRDGAPARPVAGIRSPGPAPLPGAGSLRVRVVGTADTTGDAIRVAAAVRAGRRDEVLVPISLPAGGSRTVGCRQSSWAG